MDLIVIITKYKSQGYSFNGQPKKSRCCWFATKCLRDFWPNTGNRGLILLQSNFWWSIIFVWPTRLVPYLPNGYSGTAYLLHTGTKQKIHVTPWHFPIPLELSKVVGGRNSHKKKQDTKSEAWRIFSYIHIKFGTQSVFAIAPQCHLQWYPGKHKTIWIGCPAGVGL